MQQVTFTRRLKGRMTVVRPGVLEAELTARRTRVEKRLVFSDERTFRESGTIELGGGNALEYTSLEDGTLEASADGGIKHGTSVLGVVRGLGRYAGARGRITSNFVASPDGEVTDEQVVVLFIEREED